MHTLTESGTEPAKGARSTNLAEPDLPQAGGQFRSVVLWFGIALALYVLSTGPAVRLVQAGYLPQPPINAFHAPLFAVAPEHTPQGNALMWYVFTLWKVDFPPVK